MGDEEKKKSIQSSQEDTESFTISLGGYTTLGKIIFI